MKAAVFTQVGGPENIHIEEVAKPSVAAHEVLIEIKACALNYFDLLVLAESDPEELNLPFWGGADIAGIVAEKGTAVTDYEVGDRVVVNPSLFCGQCEQCISGEESQCLDYGIIGDSIPGGMAEYIAVDAANLLKIPENLSFEEVAATPLAYQTAWRALMTRGQIKAGDDVVILGASGGVGSASIQIAKLAGARVIAITSSAEKGEQAKNSGADIVLNRNEGDYWQEIANLTNQRGVDVVIENVGKATWSQSIDSLKKGGRLVTYGRTSGHLVETDIKKIFWNQLSILGSTMGSRQDFYQVMQLVFKGKLKPVIDSVYPLEQAADAYQRLKDGNHFGKVIVKIN